MNQIRLHIWGDYACFTRPEMKVERVSYDVMTPSAARGILSAVHWKPAMRWVVDKIHVLKPIRFESVRRNELGDKISVSKINGAMKLIPRVIIQGETRYKSDFGNPQIWKHCCECWQRPPVRAAFFVSGSFG